MKTNMDEQNILQMVTFVVSANSKLSIVLLSLFLLLNLKVSFENMYLDDDMS